MSTDLTPFESGFAVSILMKYKREMELNPEFFEKMDEQEKLHYLKEIKLIRSIVEKLRANMD